MKKIMVFFAMTMMIVCFSMNASAYYFEAGDAVDQASADVVLDIVFVIDTSASLSIAASAISNNVYNVVDNLACPDCDAWVRASFLGIGGTWSGTYFDQTTYSYVAGQGGTSTVNHVEDNGPAVIDMVNWYNWNDDTTADQNYYKAVVTIGDEGTENGLPIDGADYAVANAANALAQANNVMVFGIVDTAWYGPSQGAACEALFNTMTTGTGGTTFVVDTSSNTTLQSELETIICSAVEPPPVPEPATMLLLGTGLLGLVGFNRRKKR